MKARRERGRKRPQWVLSLYHDWRTEFDRLRKLGVKFNYRSLRALGQYLLDSGNSDEYHPSVLLAWKGGINHC